LVPKKEVCDENLGKRFPALEHQKYSLFFDLTTTVLLQELTEHLNMDQTTEEKLMAQSLLLASAKHDVIAVKNLLKNTSANVQDAETGFTPLHAAVAACGPHEIDIQGDKVKQADASSKVDESESTANVDESAASEVVRLLFENGAIWNDLDAKNETPGCVAFRLGLKKTYEQIVEAGVRAELLLDKLDGITPMDQDEEQDENEDDSMQDVTADESVSAEQKTVEHEEQTHASAPAPGEQSTEPPEDYIDHWDSNNDFLRSSLRFSDKQLLDSSSNAVMMDWETEIMARHADTIMPTPGLKVMNVGHGMGIVDTEIQKRNPGEHHIIEAHPSVIESMRKNGWFDKPNVHIHQGRWQDVVPKLIKQGVVLDGIYYDTFAEDYSALRDFFNECVINLMDSKGLFGFYNGLGADRQVCYDVYTKVGIFVSLIAYPQLTVVRWLSLICSMPVFPHNGKRWLFRLSSGRVFAGRTGTSTFTGCQSVNSSDRGRHYSMDVTARV